MKRDSLAEEDLIFTKRGIKEIKTNFYETVGADTRIK